MKLYPCKALNDLPDILLIKHLIDNYLTQLTFYLLAFDRTSLYVTDFTPIYSPSPISNKFHDGTPIAFNLNGKNDFSLAYVFCIEVPELLLADIKRKLNIRNTNCQLYKNPTFASITLQVVDNESIITGKLILFDPIVELNDTNVGCLARFCKYVHADITSKLPEYLVPQYPRSETKKRKLKQSSGLKLFKSPKVTGQVLMFQGRNVSETQQYNNKQERLKVKVKQEVQVTHEGIHSDSEIMSDTNEKAVNGSDDQVETSSDDSLAKSSLKSLDTNSSKIKFPELPNTHANQSRSTSKSKNTEFVINNSTIEDIQKIPDTLQEYHNYNIFEVDAFVRLMQPLADIDNFILKPFKRTLKLTNFQLALIDKIGCNTHHVELEFMGEDMLRFFHIEEPEEILSLYESIIKKLIKLVTASVKSKVKITKRLDTSWGHQRTYWTCLNNIYELST